jgi:hypothetical protein
MSAVAPITAIDPRLAWMATAAARLTLFEHGDMNFEQACEDLFDDTMFTFQLACERADAAARKRPIDRKTKRLRQIFGSNMSFEAIYRIVNSERMS